MTPQQFQRSEEVFRAACRRPAGEQAEYVRCAVPDDDAVRDAVLQMLAHDHTPRLDFANPFGSAVRGVGERVFAGATIGERLPERIGAYRIVSKIGEGGFGVVYLAEQDNPRRTVALKVLRGTAVTPDTLKRFEYEAFILGRLHHPGIAQIYEAGVAHVPLAMTRSAETLDAAARTQTGSIDSRAGLPESAMLATPYFAMEYVDGPNLLAFADAEDTGRPVLDTRRRLELMARVCDALQHAHQHGVIHRDLKPENILVVFDDKEGTKGLRDLGIKERPSANSLIPKSLNPLIPFSVQPKILDFGVARLQEFDEQLTIVQTRVGQLVGTPAYMSPEQVGGNSAEVDTRSDVYALGVLLYRLLCGKLPYEFRGQSLSEIASVIRDQPPAPLRSVGATQRTGRFDADVSAIVMKSLAKERERRYQSAADLAADIRRYLAGLPIEAKRDSALYVLRSAIKRYRGIAAAGVVVLAASLIFSAIAIRQAIENRRLAADALTARDRATQQAESLRRSLYSSRLGYSFAAYYTNDALRMGGLLEQCPADLRGWEWSFLKRLSDRSTFTMPSSEIGPDGGRAILLPGGTKFVAAHKDRTLAGYDLVARTKLYLNPIESDYVMLAAAPDGRRFAVIHATGDITVHDATSGALMLLIPNPPENDLAHVERSAWDLSFSPDGNYLISGGLFGHAWRWDAATGARLSTWRISSAGISRLRCVPGGSHIVCCDLNGSILLWDTEGETCVERIGPLHDAPSAVAVSPDGRAFATAIGGEGIRIWDLSSLTLRTTIDSREMLIASVAFSNDAKILISAGSERVVRQWSVESGEELGSLRGHRGALSFCAFSASDQRVISAGSYGDIKGWSVPARQDLPEMRLGGADNSAFALSPDGRRAAVGDVDGTMTIVDCENLEVFARFRAHVGPIYDLEFSPDGSVLYSGGRDGALFAWTGAIPSKATRVTFGTRQKGVRSLALSADGSRIASGSVAGVIVVQDVERKRTPLEFVAHERPVRALRFSPDGMRLLSSSEDGTVRLWSAVDGRAIAELVRHSALVQDVAFDRSGNRAAAVGSDSFTVIFDTADGSERRRLKTAVRGVTGCAFSPDGRRLATCGGDRNVQIWDPETGEELLVLTGHTASVRSVQFSADGRRMVSCGSDCTLRFWETDALVEGLQAGRR
jgi:WD40 repeat protein/serine/threonine protein kinase